MLRQETAFILEIYSGERINRFEMSWSYLNLLKMMIFSAKNMNISEITSSFIKAKKKLLSRNLLKTMSDFSSAMYNYILRRITKQKIPKNQKRDFKLAMKIHKKIRLTKMVVQ